MGMSLADLDEWDPNCVHAVFAALQSHDRPRSQTITPTD